VVLNTIEILEPMTTSKINNSYNYSLVLTDKPFDFKNIQNIYPNSIQTKNTYTGNYDYITTPNLFELDAEKNVQSRYNSSWTFINNTTDANNAIAVFAGAIKFFELYRNRAVFNVPISSAASTNTVSGEELIGRFFGFDAASLAISAFKAASVTQYMLLKSTSSKPLALGTTSTPTAIYVNNDGAIKLNAASAGLSWFDFQGSTASKSSLLLPTGTAPTTPASGSIWRPSASVLNFYDGSATRQIAFTDNTALTGIPTAQTATAGTNTTQLATTAFVNTAIEKVAGIKQLKCVINQTGSNAPTFSTLRNTTGVTILMTYISTGVYQITASTATWQNGLTFIGSLNGSVASNEIVAVKRLGTATIEIRTYLGGVLTNDILRECSFNVESY